MAQACPSGLAHFGLRAWEKICHSYKLKRAGQLCVNPAIALYRRITLSNEIGRCQPLHIHFGCGEIADTRFLNVDARVFPHIHYVTTSPMMPAIPERSAQMIYACHVFEHISHPTQLKVLRRWHALLKPGGQLLLSVPDFDKVTALYHRGERDFDWMQQVLMGAQNYPGNFHFALLTRNRLLDLLAKAGFHNAREWRAAEEECWPKDWSWNESLSLNLRAESA